MMLHARLAEEDGGVVAQCVEVDVASHGDTVDEAVANLREALELYFEGTPVPKDLPVVARLEIAC